MQGVYTGMLDVYAAKILSDDKANAKPTYGAPVCVGAGIEVTITPSYREGKLDASNVVARRQKTIASYGVTMHTDVIDPAMQAYLTGRTTDANGVQVIDGQQESGGVAIAFVRTKDNGKKEYWWLLKGQFSEATVTAKTSTDSVEYQTPSLEGTFDRRICDGRLATVADEDDARIPGTVFKNWLSAVYDGDGTAEPDADTLPVGAVYAVDALPAADIDQTGVYVLTAQDGQKASGTMWRQVSGEWAQYGA